MSTDIILSVEKRADLGKEGASRVRRNGFVPGVYYDGKGVNIPVQVAGLPLSKTYEKIGSAHVFTLKIESADGVEEKPAFIWKLVHHPTKNQITHVDFYGVDLSKPIKVFVAVQLTGKPKGLVEGGTLELFRDKLEVLCLPTAIPENITIDVSDLGINDSLNIDEITMPEGVKAVTHGAHFAVVGVVPPAGADEEKAAAE